ncbi:hypothetical protein [Aeromonas jandaei]|uniref:hypothetical protein n=1 Tax=Aeromonas jandaei TaxID=650 RepID=UPI001FD85738|nr:hypothetical protein [Aeromonas jandaei]
MTLMSDVPLPHYLQIAHWLHEQQRLVSAREAAALLGGSTWAMERHFAKIRRQLNILVIDEQRVRSKGGQQYLLRIAHIHPYWLDENQQPHRQPAGPDGLKQPLTWHDLLSRQWHELLKMQQTRQ